MVVRLAIVFTIAAIAIGTLGQSLLGFISECDELTAVQILNDVQEIQEQAGQTVNKLTEFVEQDDQLQSALNTTGFSGVILIPENQAILRNALHTNQQQLIEQFKMNVILGNLSDEIRPSLQGSEIIMSSSIVASVATGASAEVIQILEFGSECQDQNSNKFEVWIISDFLPLPESAQSTLPSQNQVVISSPPPAPLEPSPILIQSNFTPLSTQPFIPVPQQGNQFAELNFADSQVPSSILPPENQFYQIPYRVSTTGFDPTNQFNASVLAQELRAPFATQEVQEEQQLRPPPPPPSQDFGDKCEKGSPIEMFNRSAEVRKEASLGAQFLEDAALEALEFGDGSIQDYLSDENFEGVILIPSDSAIQNFLESPYLNVDQFNDTEIAKIHIIPADLNINTIGPIENSLQGTSVKLIRDEYVENEDDRKVGIFKIDQVGQNCNQFEFWILRTQPLLPPPPIFPSPPPPPFSPPPPPPLPVPITKVTNPPPLTELYLSQLDTQYAQVPQLEDQIIFQGNSNRTQISQFEFENPMTENQLLDLLIFSVDVDFEPTQQPPPIQAPVNEEVDSEEEDNSDSDFEPVDMQLVGSRNAL